MPTTCFLIEPTGERKSEWVYLCDNPDCPVVDSVRTPADLEANLSEAPREYCDKCGSPLKLGKHTWTVWKNPQTGETHDGIQEFGPGAMFHADWLPESWRGPDGKALSVILPNGKVWHIDSQASNCTLPGLDHDCWCRHGIPPMITVDKTPEPGRTTCRAGAGSIAAGDYHGFLQNGVLT